MTTPFSDPSFPQIDINANEIVRLQTEIHSNNTLIQQNASNISAVVTTAAFLDTNNADNLTCEDIKSTTGKLICADGDEGNGTIFFSSPTGSFLNLNKIRGYKNNTNRWRQDFDVNNENVMRLENRNAFNKRVCDINGECYADAFIPGSDDRIKYNETDISNSLEILKQLKPKKYEKLSGTKEGKDWIPSDASWNTVKNETDASGNKIWSYTQEIGLIAQDVKKINDLSFCVIGEEHDVSGNQTILHLNYNNIFCLMLQSIKDLEEQVMELKQK